MTRLSSLIPRATRRTARRFKAPIPGIRAPSRPGSASSLTVHDGSAAEWLQHQVPTAVPPGTYNVTLELDVYVYAADAATGDLFGCGNRLYVLTDTEYNNPTWNFDGSVPAYDIRKSFWDATQNGSTRDTSKNGVWQHFVNTYTITTATGNVEFRLLQHDKHAARRPWPGTMSR